MQFLFVTSRSGVRFSKVPKLFGRNSGHMILFVSAKRRQLFQSLFPYNIPKDQILQNKRVGVLESGFSGPESFRDLRETSPRCLFLESAENFSGPKSHYSLIYHDE